MAFKLNKLFKRLSGPSDSAARSGNLRSKTIALECAARSVDSGDLQEAVSLYDAILVSDNLLVEAHYRRANALMGLGQWTLALAGYDRTLELQSNHAHAYCNRGTAFERLKRWEESLSSYDNAVKLNSSDGLAFYNRGSVLSKLKRFDDALNSFARAIELQPGYVAAYVNQGNVLAKLKRYADAITSYDSAIELDRNCAEAHGGRGVALSSIRQYGAALSSFRQAVNLKSDSVDVYINAGNALRQMLRYEDAQAAYDKAIELSSNYSEAFLGRGLTSFLAKRYESAIADFDRSLAIDKSQHFIVGLRAIARMQCCDWVGLEPDVHLMEQGLRSGLRVCSPFEALPAVDSPELHLLASQIWVQKECPPDDRLGEITTRISEGRLRIGYFSADFHEHPVSSLAVRLFELHDRSKFEIIAFSFGVGGEGPMRSRLLRSFDRFIDVQERSDLEVVTLARELGLDIAVDLGGYTEKCRTGIFALRAAPIQVNYLGYPSTMGSTYFEYMIADRTVISDAQLASTTEKIAYLPNCYLPFDSTRQISAHVYSREELGLPSVGFVYCCFNSTYKINAHTFAGWMRVLARTPLSVLWLSAAAGEASHRLRSEAVAHGVDPGRLVFAERFPSSSEHLARHSVADLFLDTFPYNAHATAIDALWAGVPVVTRCGQAFAGRVGASLLEAIGLPELMTTTAVDYEDMAVELALNPDKLAGLRRKLLKNRGTSLLFDSARTAQDIEMAYELMYRRLLSGLPPTNLFVSS